MKDEAYNALKKGVTKFKFGIKKSFARLSARNYGAFLTKENDKFVKGCYDTILAEFFGDFLPQSDKIPVLVLAYKRYARAEISPNHELQILLVYKEIPGFSPLKILTNFISKMEFIGLKTACEIYEIDQIYELCKENFKQKDAFFQIRFICGSKALYKLAKEQISRLKEYKKDDYINYHFESLKPYDDIKFLKLEPDIVKGYGGTRDAYRMDLLLSQMGENPKQTALKYINEDEYSKFALSLDNIICLKNALELAGGEDLLRFGFLNDIGEIMQTKEKKSLDIQALGAQKMLNSMHDVALYSRFVAKMVYNEYFGKKFSENARKIGNFIIDNEICHAPNLSNVSLKKIIKDIANLPDLPLKFDISAIIYMKRANLDCDIDALMGDFKKIFARKHLYTIINSMLNSEILFTIVKPMQHTRYLAQFDGYSEFGVDDHSVLGLYHLEHISDEFVQKLYDKLNAQEKIMLKLVILMHDVGKGISNDHPTLGANIFRAYGAKFGLAAKEINSGVLLIKNHTLMNDVATEEDIYSQRVIFGVISKLTHQKFVDLLYILTYCNVSASNSKPINSYFLRLLREFYDICIQNFDETKLLDGATRRVKKEASIKRLKEFEQLSKPQKAAVFKISSNLLFIKYQPDEILRISRLAQKGGVFIRNFDNLIVEIVAPSNTKISNLLAKLATFDLAYMEIFELYDEKAFFKFEYNTPFSGHMGDLEKIITKELKEKKPVIKLRPEILESEISFDLEHSKIYAQLKINAKNQTGFMAYVMSVFEKFDVKIGTARIQTIKNRTRNLFLIQKGENLIENYKEIMNLLIKREE